MAGNRPGVMLYFETLQAIDELEAEDAKQIMGAILRYSRDGEAPAFRGTLAALWSLIQSSLDRDEGRYGEKQMRGRWLTYCRQCKATGEDPLSFDEWVSAQYDNDTLLYVERAVDGAVNGTSPSTSTSTSTSTTPTTTPATSPTPTIEKYRGCGGCAFGAHTPTCPKIAFALSPSHAGRGCRLCPRAP